MRALADFSGAVLLITHDAHLVELVADRLWLVADGTVRTSTATSTTTARCSPSAPARAGEGRRGADAAGGAARARRGPRRRRAAAPAGTGRGGADRETGGRARGDRGAAGRPAAVRRGRAAEITEAQTRLAAIARETEAAEAAWLAAEEALEGAVAE